MRRRIRYGIGPLSRPRWKSSAFALDVPLTGETIEAADDLTFECASSPEGWILTGKVSGVACLYGEVRRDRMERGFSFTMLSVSDREVSGRAAMVGGVNGEAEDAKGSPSRSMR